MMAIYGIVGEGDLSEVRAMGMRLAHRGPDSIEWSVSVGVHFGQRGARLTSPSPGWPIVFDGFLDNAQELASLLGWRTLEESSDASLVLEVFRRFGPEGFRHLTGHYAIAIWDGENGRVILARDRWGARSLYVATGRGRHLFASEYKALLVAADVTARPDPAAIQHVQRTKYPPPDACFLKDVRPVPGGSWLATGRECSGPRRYWDVAIEVSTRSTADHAGAVRSALLDGLRAQTRRHRVLGAALSGGLDSAAMVAAIRNVAPEKDLLTFTTGFGTDDPEVVGAREVAWHFGTRHQETFVGPTELPQLLPRVVWHMEGPIGREERVFHFLTAREAAKHVGILFAGHKSDALFGGMPRHKLIRAATLLPVLRAPLEELYHYTQTGTSPRTALGRALVRAAYSGTPVAPPCVVGAASPAAAPRPIRFEAPEPLSETLRLAVLNDVDVSAVGKLHAAFALDFNSPFMHSGIVECAFRIPDALKIHGLRMRQKYILRRAFSTLLPDEILKRKKSLARLRHDAVLSDVLESLAQELLGEVATRGLFEQDYVDRIRRRPPRAPYPAEQLYRLWTLLLTEIWCRLYLDARGAAPEPSSREAHGRLRQPTPAART